MKINRKFFGKKAPKKRSFLHFFIDVDILKRKKPKIVAPRATNRAQARHQSQPSATSATPATRNEGWCEQVPRLPAKRWSMSPSATPATQMSPSERWFVKRGPRRTRRRSGRRRDGYRIKNKNPTQRCGEKYLHAKILDSRFSILDSRSSSKTNSRFSILHFVSSI